MKLSELRPGQQATILDLVGEADLVQRLLELGLTDGEPVQVLRVAPLGDPLLISIRGYQLSLRRTEAAAVIVSSLT